MYFSRLDTIRWYAAAAVVLSHILQIWTWQPQTVMLIPLGYAGVVAFFVLSGFLITWLLLQEPDERPFGQSLTNFYLRRSLRIFPIYFLYLAITYGFNIDAIREAGVYPWVYLTNIYLFKENTWLNAHSHLWSLSVEEQFYLVWPFLVLFFRRNTKLLLGLFCAICALALGARLYLWFGGFNPSPQMEVFTLSCLDYLALGSLLALGYQERRAMLQKLGPYLLFIGPLVYYLTCLLQMYFQLNALYWSVGKFSLGVTSAGLILCAIFGREQYGLLHNRATVHLGKISYGIYLYHNVLVAYYADIAALFGLVNTQSLGARILLSTVIVLVVAQCSWWLVEAPLLRLKQRFR